LFASGNNAGIVHISTFNKTIKAVLESGDNTKVVSCAFSPDGTQLKVVHEDGFFVTWNVQTGDRINGTNASRCPCSIRQVSFNSDTSLVACCFPNEQKFQIRNHSSGDVVHEFTHDQNVNRTQFSPTGNQIISVSDDTTVKIWDLTTGTCLTTLETPTAVRSR
jgi:WD40 repeat protein